MAKGITAFFVVTALVISMSILSGIGMYDALGVEVSDDANSDVQSAADAMTGQEAGDESQDNVIEDFTTSAGQTLSMGWQVISNLSGVLQMLFGVPKALADSVQVVFMLTYGITFAAFIRGVVLQ